MSDIFDEIKRFEREMDILLSNFMNSSRGIPYSGGWRPPINIFEKDNSLIILIEAAGVNPDSLKVILDKNILTISGKREDPFSRETRDFYSMEIPFGTFERRINLPYDVDAEKTVVKNEDGFIQIILLKAPSEEKIIEIE
ncbi:MAG: Hsp20/alpha crystallin family protein [candidate division WOR-3 bacterium]|nr:Hsp20/alpha crystallin family protein [candidate division WOR-3 bacterium]